ncbi:hypothetical protein [Pseudomonas yamanorum]|uniref:hypothetical protein n=1 Tax=Pseudomonas yamanorum TaxID=515393 RepID=UPI003D35CFA6
MGWGILRANARDDIDFVYAGLAQDALLGHPSHYVSQAMSDDDKLIDLNAERAKRVHDLNDKRLNEVRQAFEQAMPLGKAKKKPKNKPKKR